MTEDKLTYPGLSSEEVRTLQERYGKNELTGAKREGFFRKALHILCEPMFLLLLAAAVIYFVLGEPGDGSVMLVFVLGVIGIDMVQEWKTDRTLNALRDLSAPRITVVRDGKEMVVNSAELVPGDLMLISEGVKIPADGVILQASDLCVDESTLTGEAEGVWKTAESGGEPSDGYWRRDYCYAGTLVTQGSAYIRVEQTGDRTEYGRIGANVSAAPQSPSPLQRQTGSLVRLCAAIAGVLFTLVAILTYLNIPDHDFKSRVIESVLSGITLAMAMIPEEFPVILTVFLSMGAWRLAKKNALVRTLPAVETLGAVSVLCVDKTGTITKNQMTVTDTWALGCDGGHLAEIMGLGCETTTYDPMEMAMLSYCDQVGISREHLFAGTLLQEYPFTNRLKMMGHVWRHDGEIVVAAKGSPERILKLCDLTVEDRKLAEDKIVEMSGRGLRVIAVAQAHPQTEVEIPPTLEDCRLTLCGLVGLADPPRETVKEDIARCVKAGVRVVMITGDNGATASSIAGQIGMPNAEHILTGSELDAMSDEELRAAAERTGIFSRVIPEHKMRIVKAFQANGRVVAMTGDGVNDAPALKHADIGIAMGKRGSEVSREAADLILLDDNFSTIVDTIRDARRIYENIRKAVGYVIAIHIPIALSSLLAPMLRISPANLFLLPLHVVLLELLIDPTCSVVLERQSAERDVMSRPPRDPKENILKAGLLVKSFIQGLFVFAASFGAYFAMDPFSPSGAAAARTMGLSVILLANLLLVLVNGSERDFAVYALWQLRRDKVMWAAGLGTVAGLLALLYTPLSGYLKLVPLSVSQLALALALAAASVLWYELVKAARKLAARSGS